MSENIYSLGTKARRTPVKALDSGVLYQGREYHLTTNDGYSIDDSNGMVGDYRVSLQSANTEPVCVEAGSARVYFYDSEARLDDCNCSISDNGKSYNSLKKYQVRGNRFSLLATALEGPELISNGQQTLLSMRPTFRMHYAAEAYTTQLGVVHLVQSQRFLLLENGSRISLLDTGGSVLYLQDPLATEPVQLIGSVQGKGHIENHDYQLSLGQVIPEQLDGESVESVTVLEQYKSYFMQRECSDYTRPVIWTPLLAAVSWGWSIRVGHRVDGEWEILRRKLIRPTVGNEGLELPQWQTNHLTNVRTTVV